MIHLEIDPQFKEIAPAVAVGVLTASVRVTEHDADLWRQIDAAVTLIAGRLSTMQEVRRLPPIHATWQAYKNLGQDPTRYRGSAEALYRRIIHGKGLYRVNTVVDINNLISLECMCSCGTTDLERVQPPVVFRAGRPDEAYAGIGRGAIKLAKIPVFVDVAGPFASTTSDSERAMVTSATTRLLMLIISFVGRTGLPATLERSVSLLRQYASAADVETAIVE